MFALVAGVFFGTVLFFLGQRRSAGYALLAGLVGLLLHRVGSTG